MEEVNKTFELIINNIRNNIKNSLGTKDIKNNHVKFILRKGRSGMNVDKYAVGSMDHFLLL